ncbi:Na(+)/H(+) antiporter subunit C [Flaviflexus huanghaiensis]|uniref:Na(+)/H(+) antiporter subunit C n=1 Tax=Flaviflexus huanghaiensis TaxID=1111473 RepID=UPI0015FCA43E|nr:Na(+)/H(+) antiporter subunit C [Flaviflexus huanghaiensis]
MIDTTPSLSLVVLAAVLVAVGVYLILERSLSRIILGFSSLANGVNIAFLIAGGRAGAPPLVGQAPADEMSDPLTQAMMLTAIVITMGTTAFMLALAYRAWQLDANDEVQDDIEDKRLAAMAERDERLVRDEQNQIDEAVAETYDEMQDDSLSVGDDR